MNETINGGLWKFLRRTGTGMESNYDGHQWEVGKWYRVPMTGKMIDECRGFNCCYLIPDALSYVQGEILALVEGRGDSYMCERKQTWEWMRVVQTWEWSRKMSVQLAIFSAEQALPQWEKVHPEDDRPLKAILAARRWVNQPEDKAAARAAARAAEDAAWATTVGDDVDADAARAARAAAWAARAAARAAAWAAAKATWAAAWAARDASDAVRAAAEAEAWAARDDAWVEARAAAKERSHKFVLTMLMET